MQIKDIAALEKLKVRYAGLYPLIFHRSIEHARNETELFDILDSFPSEFPVAWDEKERKWKTQPDLVRFQELQDILGES
jgi:hypothetical protein